MAEVNSKDVIIKEDFNPYRECIQGLANEPICVLHTINRSWDFVRNIDPSLNPEKLPLTILLTALSPINQGLLSFQDQLIIQPICVMICISASRFFASGKMVGFLSIFQYQLFVMALRKTILVKATPWLHAMILPLRSILPLKDIPIMPPMFYPVAISFHPQS